MNAGVLTLHLELRGGDDVGSALVGVGGDLLLDEDGKVVLALEDAEGARGLLALAVDDLGKLVAVVGGNHSSASLGLGLHGTGLQKAELVPKARIRGLLCPGRDDSRPSDLMIYLHAVGAVGNAAGRKVGDLEDSLSGDTGGDGEEGSGELHLDGWVGGCA